MNNPQAESRFDFAQVVEDAAPIAGSSRPGPPLAALTRLTVAGEVLRLLPADFVKQHRVLPLEIREGTLHVATADPGNPRVIEDIRLLSGLEVQEVEAPGPELLEKIAECYQVTVEQMVENLSPDNGASVEGKNLHDIEVMANEPTVINLVNVIISNGTR